MILRQSTIISSVAPPRIPVTPSLLLRRRRLSLPLCRPPVAASLLPRCCSNASTSRLRISDVAEQEEGVVSDVAEEKLSSTVGSPWSIFPARLAVARMSLGDQAFFLLAFIACTTSVAFASLVVAVIPTLFAIKRAAISLAKLADTAREELPSTMAAIRLSGMEISDLTLELSDLSQEIADGVNKSAQVAQAAEAGIRQIGALARTRTVSMIQERANLPNISLRPVVVGAAKKTSRLVGKAKDTFMHMISNTEDNSETIEQGGSTDIQE